MARICIYNSTKTLDTAGGAIDHSLTAVAASARRTKPVRLFTPDGEIRYCAFEFIYSGNIAAALDLRFFLEYFNDAPSLGAPPNLRVGVGINPNVPWAREVNEVIGGAGVITHTEILRSLSIAADAAGAGSARWLPFVVHSMWLRLAVYVNAAVPAGATLGIYANVGGHLEETYLETYGDTPYAYNT